MAEAQPAVDIDKLQDAVKEEPQDEKKTSSVEAPKKLNIAVEFGGGLGILFEDQREIRVAIPSLDSEGKPVTMKSLISHLYEHEMKSHVRRDLFILDGQVRPGILVMINEADWELEGEEAYVLQDGDGIVFISTLHGG